MTNYLLGYTECIWYQYTNTNMHSLGSNVYFLKGPAAVTYFFSCFSEGFTAESQAHHHNSTSYFYKKQHDASNQGVNPNLSVIHIHVASNPGFGQNQVVATNQDIAVI